MARYADPHDAPTWPPTLVAPPNTATRPPRRRVVRTLLLLGLALTLVASAIAWTALTATRTSYAGSHFNIGQNAVWLEHTWAGDPHTAAEYDQLAARLKSAQIRYVFAHVGPLASDGSIPDALAPAAAQLTTQLHARLPSLHVLAWIGQMEASSGAPPDQVVNLDDSRVRDRIAQTAAHFVRDRGFDGVHYDIEPIRNNSPRFLDLLDATRAALPAGAMLSISGQKWAPNATIAEWVYRSGRAGAWWTSYYYAAVAARVDQIAVMTYDTGMPAGPLYEALVKQETEHILEVVRTARTPPSVLFGVPTYDGDSTWFHASAENMATGLRGITAGLNSTTTTRPFQGVALYRFATVDDAEWATYEHLWLGR